jgi:hypothetical protein
MAENRIFISYRRADTDADANALYQTLAAHFGDGSIFKDVDNIPIGSNFRLVISEALSSTDVMLVLVGPGWQSTQPGGVRSLERPNDFVRIELESALEASIPIIPILVRGAKMPSASELPESCRDFAYMNAAEVEHRSWRRDMGPVLEAVTRHVREAGRRRGRLTAHREEVERAIRAESWDVAETRLAEFRSMVTGSRDERERSGEIEDLAVQVARGRTEEKAQVQARRIEGLFDQTSGSIERAEWDRAARLLSKLREVAPDDARLPYIERRVHQGRDAARPAEDVPTPPGPSEDVSEPEVPADSRSAASADRWAAVSAALTTARDTYGVDASTEPDRAVAVVADLIAEPGESSGDTVVLLRRLLESAAHLRAAGNGLLQEDVVAEVRRRGAAPHLARPAVDALWEFLADPASSRPEPLPWVNWRRLAVLGLVVVTATALVAAVWLAPREGGSDPTQSPTDPPGPVTLTADFDPVREGVFTVERTWELGTDGQFRCVVRLTNPGTRALSGTHRELPVSGAVGDGAVEWSSAPTTVAGDVAVFSDVQIPGEGSVEVAYESTVPNGVTPSRKLLQDWYHEWAPLAEKVRPPIGESDPLEPPTVTEG